MHKDIKVIYGNGTQSGNLHWQEYNRYTRLYSDASKWKTHIKEQIYGIPHLSLEGIRFIIYRLKDYASEHPELRFHVMRFLSDDYSDEEIASLFVDITALNNITLPRIYVKIITRIKAIQSEIKRTGGSYIDIINLPEKTFSEFHIDRTSDESPLNEYVIPIAIHLSTDWAQGSSYSFNVIDIKGKTYHNMWANHSFNDDSISYSFLIWIFPFLTKYGKFFTTKPMDFFIRGGYDSEPLCFKSNWNEIYMAAGNILLLRNDIYARFIEISDNHELTPEKLYRLWYIIVSEILKHDCIADISLKAKFLRLFGINKTPYTCYC